MSSQSRLALVGIGLSLSLAACLGDPVGPRGTLVVARVGVGPDSQLAGAPGRVLGAPVVFRAMDGDGRPILGATVRWSVVTGHGRVEQADGVTAEDGTFHASWVLGTKASEVQNLEAEVQVGPHKARAAVAAVAIPVEVASLKFQVDTTQVRVGVAGRVRAEATDSFGNRFVPAGLRFASLDTALAVVDSGGNVLARRRGYAPVLASVGGVTDTALVHAIQVVQSIAVDHDTLRFHSIGQGQLLAVTLTDDQGLPVLDSLPSITPKTPGVVDIGSQDPFLIQSQGNGVAEVVVQVGGVSHEVIALVQQRTASLSFGVPDFHFNALDDTTRAALVILDSLGVPVVSPHITFTSTDPAVVTVDSAGLLTARGNGAAIVTARSASGVVTAAPVNVTQSVARVTVGRDSLQFDALQAMLPVQAVARDRLGTPVPGAVMAYATADSAVATVDASGNVRALGNGATVITVTQSGETASVTVRVTQRPVRLQVSGDTVRFNALGQSRAFTAVALDSLGSPLNAAGVVGLRVTDPAVAEPIDSAALRARGNGVTEATFTVAGLAGRMVLAVAQVPATVGFTVAAPRFNALRDTVRATVVAADSLGAPITGQAVTFASSDTAVAGIDGTGLVTAHGNGETTVLARSGAGVEATLQVLVSQRVAAITVGSDTLHFEALQAVQAMNAVARDRLGSPVANAVNSYASGDAAVAAVDANGNVRATGNGAATLRAANGADTALVSVRVSQRPVRVQLASDTLRFDALGQTQTIAARALDSLGSPVEGGVVGLRVTDTSVAQLTDSTAVLARRNGLTDANFAVAGMPGRVVLAVEQIPARLTASVTFGKPIVTLPVGAPLPLECQVFDGNGFVMLEDPALAGSINGTASGAHCSDVRIQRSGIDTLTFALGAAQARVAVTIAAAPVASAPLGEFAVADTLPGQPGNTWAPSARRNERGDLEVYYTVYSGDPDSSGSTRGDLHRLIWLGGNQFRYDGIAVRHDDNICSPEGQGIENTVVLPRSDSAGWRMLYAAGSNTCYGWQVFSAVSSDGRTWTKESGIRLSNGGTDPSWPPWPVGEGMVVDRLPSGEWRMIAGSFEHITPPETTKWEITEWRSADQLHWTYIGPVLTTRDMPSGWQGSVYSPTIREFAPGLLRMLFTATDRGSPDGRDAVWSAVSTDRTHWQVEGEVLGGQSSNLYYASLVDDHVVFIRQDNGGPMHLSIASVIMP